jgi:four helix bundle protein
MKMSDSFMHWKKRTKEFALRTIQLTASLPADKICNVIGRQLLRSGTSVGANDRCFKKDRN